VPLLLCRACPGIEPIRAHVAPDDLGDQRGDLVPIELTVGAQLERAHHWSDLGLARACARSRFVDTLCHPWDNPRVLDLDDLRSFKKVALMKSFASAARALGLPRSTVSRNVARLERELGARLFQRTTREVALTPTGEVLLQRCAGILGALEDAVDQIRSSTSIPHGPLRVTTGVGFGLNLLSQELPEFLVRYPGVTVSLDLSSETKDLVTDADVAIRLGPMPNSGLVSARLRTLTRHLCVSPSYIERRGLPASLEELCEHDTIEMPGAFGRPRSWTFTKDGEIKNFEIPTRICVNEALAIHRLVTHGAGIGIISGYLCQPAFASGQLSPLFPDWSIPPVDVNVVFASKRELSPNVRAFVDFMKERLGAPSDDGLESPSTSSGADPKRQPSALDGCRGH